MLAKGMERMIYTSGIFDVIGTISVSTDRSGSFSPQVGITSSNFDLVDYCWTTFGLGGISEIREGVWSWYVAGQSDILYILTQMLPWLIVKEHEANILIEYLTSRMNQRAHNAPYGKREVECVLGLIREGTKTWEVAIEKWKKLQY